jgi:putative flippase GtrA
VGVVNTLIDFGVLNALLLLTEETGGMALLACNAVAFLCANLNSYFANRTWTFAGPEAASLNEFGVFLGIAFLGLLINSLVLWLLTSGLPSSLGYINLAKIGATGVSMVWNFCGYRMLLTRQVAV